MRYGCCVNMISSHPELGGIDVAGKVKAAGFDYAELSLTHLNMLKDDQLKRLQEELQKHDLPAESSNNFFPPTMPLTGNRVDYNAISIWIDKCFETALLLGIKTIVFGSGGARMVPEGFPMEKAWEQLARVLLKIEPYARESRIKIAIEPLRKQECNIINTYEEACTLAAMAGKPSIGCLADAFHLNEENEPAENIVLGKEYLSHVHVAYPVGRIYPGAAHHQEMSSFVQALVAADYHGRMSIEAFTDNFDRDSVESLKLLKAIEMECMEKLNY